MYLFLVKKKGTLPLKRGHFFSLRNFWGGLGPLGPPGSYAPVHDVHPTALSDNPDNVLQQFLATFLHQRPVDNYKKNIKISLQLRERLNYLTY